MNLKEAFRYQTYLKDLMSKAYLSLIDREHALKVTNNHLRSKANPDAEDVTMEAEVDPFFPNDDVIRFMEWLIGEREKLSNSIADAKHWMSFDLDAAIEANKFRQSAINAIKRMLEFKASKRMSRGSDYKFNNEGVQAPYVYDIEVVSEEAYDRESASATMKTIRKEADNVSAEIDAAMVTTRVSYEPAIDVGDSFEDAMKVYLSLTSE